MADVLYIIRHVPSSDAMSLRCASIIRQLRSCGLSVDLMTTFAAPVNERAEELILGADSFYYPCVLKSSQKGSRFFEMALGFRASRWVARYIDECKPKAVLFYGGTSTLVSRVLKHARQSDVKVMVDETDWFEPNSSMNAYARTYYTLDNHRLRHVDAGLDGIIAISPYFYEHFSRVNRNVLFFPPCVDKLPPERVDQGRTGNRSTSFVYAGSLGPGKDILIPFARALISYRHGYSEGLYARKILLKVVGVEARDMARELSVPPSELEPLGIECYGRVTHDKTLEIVRSCDFGLLLRHPQLYARAGFSTKAVEYLTNGLPLLCNAVGGVDTLIDSGADGFVLGPEETDEESLLAFLQKLEQLDCVDIDRMSSSARLKASRLFMEEHYQGAFRSFLEAAFN